jgi:hypothetical protein
VIGVAAVIAGAVVAIILASNGSGARAASSTACVSADNGRAGSGHFRFITSACENASSTTATLPLHRGTSNGQTVWYVVTDDSSASDAKARGVNYVPKLRNAIGSPAVQVVSVNNGVVEFPATVDFHHARHLQPGPTGFPPAAAEPPAVGNPGYSPLIKLPDGTVINAPQIANSSGRADKVLGLDTGHMTVQYKETEGRYEDKHVHYMSFESGSPIAATIEDVTFAPALNMVPKQGNEGLKTSSREKLVAFVNGDTGTANPQRQGENSTVLDGLDPHNILHETPVLPGHEDIGHDVYAPMWDVHFAEWTREAINAGDREELRSTDEVMERVGKKLITSPGGAPFGPAGFVVNCPLLSIDVP